MDTGTPGTSQDGGEILQGAPLLHKAIDDRDPTAWNAWRKAHWDAMVMYEDRNLDCAKLDGFVFHRVQFVRTIFLTAELSNCTFSETSFRECEWNLTTFRDCDLDGVTAYSIEARKARLVGCDLRGADFRGAALGNAQFEACDLEAATLAQAGLKGAVLARCNLAGVSLDKANLSEATMTESRLQDVDLRSANLTEARLQRCDLTGAKLWNAQVGGCRFVDIECTSAAFDEAGEAQIRFAPGRFERIYGGALRVGLTFEGGLMVADLLAIPALIECLQREFPGCDIGISSLNEVGDTAEMIVTAKSRTLIDEAQSVLLKRGLERRLNQLHGELRSSRGEMAQIRDNMLAVTERLVEHLTMNNRSMTFNGPVTAGLIGDSAHVSGGVVAASDQHAQMMEPGALAALLEQIGRLSVDLDAQRHAEVLQAIVTLQGVGKPSAGVLKHFGHTVRNIAEGAVGSLAASGILAVLAQHGLG